MIYYSTSPKLIKVVIVNAIKIAFALVPAVLVPTNSNNTLFSLICYLIRFYSYNQFRLSPNFGDLV